MKSYIDNLERLGHPVSLNLGVGLILISLRKEFDSFVQNYNMHSMGKTVNELHDMMKLHEQTLTKKDPALHAIRGKSKLAYAPKPKIHPPPERENLAKDSICHQCGDTGHWKKNCPRYLAELLKNKKLSQGASDSGIFTIELYTFPNKSWVYDTGCGTHICNTTQGLRGSRKLKPEALSLYMGNGQRAAVKAIGTYHLCLSNGLVIILNNCHYTLSITRGIISVSKFDVSRDGIFETDLSNSNTIDSSMYVVSNKRAKLNLDSALLWHRRLGHIKNRLRKTIRSLRSDHEGEYISQEFLDHLKEHEIIAHSTPPYTPQHNGVSKRRNRTLLDMVEKTPYEVWHGQAPKRSYLKVLGCEALVKRDILIKPDKLEPRSIKCIFVGYPKETMGYSFYYPPENKVLVSRNAKFLKNSIITQEASRSLEDLEIIQEEDTHPSIDTSLNHKEDDLEIDKL
nr:hypothetical protein [Tanacetum cinerariifolium]